MQLRQLGQSDVKVPPVIFGAWAIGGWYWGGTDDDDAIDAIKAAVDSGISAIDTAPFYGFGHSEKIVGKAIKGMRDRVIIATKAGLRWDRTDGEHHVTSKKVDITNPDMAKELGDVVESHRVLKKDSIIEECENSLKRLDIETIDLYQCHWPDQTTPLEETMEALNQLLEQGKIRAIGVSNFTPEMMAKCKELGPLASDQPKYSLLDRKIEADVLPWCRENNVGVIVYSPLEQGMLTGKVTMDREFPEADRRSEMPWFQPENRKRVLEALDEVKPIAEKYGVTLAQLTINWTFSVPGITSAIVGARNANQAAENAKAMSFALSEDEKAKIRSVFESLGGPQ